MNNLSLVQEAAIGPTFSADGICLDGGNGFIEIVPPRLGRPKWRVRIVGDPLVYSFGTMAEALDFAAAEFRLM